ncbi:reverse transcriptase [Tanacetum coccineum]
MASDGSDQDARYALSNLLQMGMVAEYESEFVVHANRVTGISESLLTLFYISGLKLVLQIYLLRARPKTLRESFTLARINETRFEDERATTVIAKPNDLNISGTGTKIIEETTLPYFRQGDLKEIVKRYGKAVAKAIEKYEKTKADSNNAVESWISKYWRNFAPIDAWMFVFEICKCAEDDKIPWSNVKAMMTTEYCPATEIQRMEQELWTLTLKGDDIEAYNNRFHELVLMCPELVSTEKKRLKSTFEDFPRESKEMLLLQSLRHVARLPSTMCFEN